jgi:hypothetical protein
MSQPTDTTELAKLGIAFLDMLLRVWDFKVFDLLNKKPSNRASL